MKYSLEILSKTIRSMQNQAMIVFDSVYSNETPSAKTPLAGSPVKVPMVTS